MMNDMNETHISMCRFDVVVDENGNGKCEAIRWDPAWIRGFQKKPQNGRNSVQVLFNLMVSGAIKKAETSSTKFIFWNFGKRIFLSWAVVGVAGGQRTHTHTQRKGRRGKICSSSLTFVAGISVMRQLYRLVFVDSVFARITFVFNMPLLIIQQFPRGSAGRPRAPSLIIIFYQVQIIRNNWQCINCNGWHFCWS